MRRESNYIVGLISLMQAILVCTILVIGLFTWAGNGCGCTHPAATVATLQKSGYTDVQPGGIAWFMCGSGDFYATKFDATNPVGERVSGTSCCGLVFKGCTIRY